MATTTSNLLRIKGENLELLDSKGTPRWALPVKSVVLIAEYTTNEGPYADDYFLVFVTAEESQLYFSTCPVSSAGIEEGLNLLQQRLGSSIQLELQGCTEWRSRVAWPPEMQGTEYFTFKPTPAETFAQRIKKRLLGPTYEYGIARAVQEYLRGQLNARSF
jgi:hypothetical protein